MRKRDAEGGAAVRRQRALVAGVQEVDGHPRGEGREAEARVQAARRERRYRARRVPRQQPARAGDARQHPAHGDASAPPLARRRALQPEARRHAGPEAAQRLRRPEPRCVAAHPHVHLLAVVHHPGDVAGRQLRVEPAVERGLTPDARAAEHLLHPHDPLAVLVQPECGRHPRHRPVGAHHEARPQPLPPAPSLQRRGGARPIRLERDEGGRRRPLHAGAQARVQHAAVQRAHTAHPELVVRTLQLQRPTPRRIQSTRRTGAPRQSSGRAKLSSVRRTKIPVVCTAWSTAGLRSASSTRAPAAPSRRAHSRPASPAPTTSTSTPRSAPVGKVLCIMK